MKKLLTALFALALLSGAAPAKADGMFHWPTNWYVEVGGGITPFAFADKREGNVFGTNVEVMLDCEGCVALYGTIGAYIAENVRAEYQFSYQHAAVASIEFPAGAPPFDISGNLDIFTNMLNVLYEFHLDPGFIPYIGGGLGFTYVETDNVGFPPAVASNDEDVVFSASLIVGVDVPINQMVTFTTRYTAGYTAEADFDVGGGLATYTQDDHFTHYISAGLRFDINEVRGWLR